MEIYRDDLAEQRSTSREAANNTKFGENKENQDDAAGVQQSPSRRGRNNRKETDVVQRTVLEDVTHRYTTAQPDEVVMGDHHEVDVHEMPVIERHSHDNDGFSRSRRHNAPRSNNFTRMMR